MSEVKRPTQAPKSVVKIQVCEVVSTLCKRLDLFTPAIRLLLPFMSTCHNGFPLHEKCKTNSSILGRLCLNRVHSLAANIVTRIRILTGEAHGRGGQDVAASRLGEIRGGRAIRDQAALAVGRSTGHGRAARLGGDTGRGGLGRGDGVALRLGDRGCRPWAIRSHGVRDGLCRARLDGGNSVAFGLGDRCSRAGSSHGLCHLIRLCLDHCDCGRLGRAIAGVPNKQTSKFWWKGKISLRDCCNRSHSFRDIGAGRG